MTKLLQKAFAAASKLPETEQNIFAKWLLDEFAVEKRWETTFADSEDVLSKLRVLKRNGIECRPLLKSLIQS